MAAFLLRKLESTLALHLQAILKREVTNKDKNGKKMPHEIDQG